MYFLHVPSMLLVKAEKEAVLDKCQVHVASKVKALLP